MLGALGRGRGSRASSTLQLVVRFSLSPGFLSLEGPDCSLVQGSCQVSKGQTRPRGTPHRNRLVERCAKVLRASRRRYEQGAGEQEKPKHWARAWGRARASAKLLDETRPAHPRGVTSPRHRRPSPSRLESRIEQNIDSQASDHLVFLTTPSPSKPSILLDSSVVLQPRDQLERVRNSPRYPESPQRQQHSQKHSNKRKARRWDA